MYSSPLKEGILSLSSCSIPIWFIHSLYQNPVYKQFNPTMSCAKVCVIVNATPNDGMSSSSIIGRLHRSTTSNSIPTVGMESNKSSSVDHPPSNDANVSPIKNMGTSLAMVDSDNALFCFTPIKATSPSHYKDHINQAPPKLQTKKKKRLAPLRRVSTQKSIDIIKRRGGTKILSSIPVPSQGSIDTYEITDREDNGIFTDSDDEDHQSEPKKRVPSWARSRNLIPALIKQFGGETINSSDLFPPVKLACDLQAIFGAARGKRRRHKRARPLINVADEEGSKVEKKRAQQRSSNKSTTPKVQPSSAKKNVCVAASSCADFACNGSSSPACIIGISMMATHGTESAGETNLGTVPNNA